MPMYSQPALAAERNKRGQPDAVHADHDASAAGSRDSVVPPQHLVDLSGDVAGVHHLSPIPVGVPVDDPHHGVEALLEWAVRAVGLQFIILDEVDAATCKSIHHLRGSAG